MLRYLLGTYKGITNPIQRAGTVNLLAEMEGLI